MLADALPVAPSLSVYDSDQAPWLRPLDCFAVGENLNRCTS